MSITHLQALWDLEVSFGSSASDLEGAMITAKTRKKAIVIIGLMRSDFYWIP